MHVSGNIHIRRVQRLGTSSLVVTLPKEWVKRVGIEKGDNVYIIDEGLSLRIVPSNAAKLERSVELNISDTSGIKLLSLLSCAYVMGLERIVVRGVSWMDALSARSVATRLYGVSVTAEGDTVEMTVLQSADDVNPSYMIHTIARLGVDIIGLIERLSREPSPSLAQLAREARNEIVKYEHLAVRMLTKSRGFGAGDAVAYYLAGVVGDAVASIWELAALAAARVERGSRLELSEEHEKLLEKAKEIFDRFARFRGSREEAGEIARLAEELRAEAHKTLVERMDAVSAVIAEAAKWLDIAASITMCKTIL